MKHIKRMMIKIVLLAELCLFGYAYLYGKNGIQTFFEKREENAELVRAITILAQEVAHIESEINAWQSNDFYKEKVAREQLQMAREDDEIFYRGT